MVSKFKHLPALDGVRAYAVLLVLFYHTKLPFFSYGWVGVQIFFVLSGFLITSILLKTKDSASYFNTFYIRRSLRIFPIYYMSLAFVLMYSIINGLAKRDVIYYLFYLQNYKLGIYDFQIKFPEFFNHTWSLAVEEQFYLFWPLAIKFMPNKKLFILCIVLIISSIVSKFLVFHYTESAIIWTNILGNLDMLCGGALISIIFTFSDFKNYFKWFNIILLVLIGSYFIGPYFLNYQTFINIQIRVATLNGITFLIFILASSMLLVKCLSGNYNYFTKILFENSIAVYIGKISYGIYVYHYITIFFIEKFFINLQDVFLMTLKIGIPIVLSILSFELLERRILHFKNKFKYS